MKSASLLSPSNTSDIAAVPDQTLADIFLNAHYGRHILFPQGSSGSFFVSLLRLPPNWPNVRKLAYDWIKKQLYLVDSNAGTVQVSSTDGNQRCFVKSRLPQPKDIAIDPFNK